jgi:hypothetical protein
VDLKRANVITMEIEGLGEYQQEVFLKALKVPCNR